eukprot:gnl/Dysnectes_brevis/6415_a9938_350.p1 GENE.gnl/Dysnectes_brevis/6415_a9938_350~~gnl/Dysnectes_brevis/6415_a9938_350.p1  ORF type:complete len:666 (-),score=204.29 gnl/Dysnectes_brevis/6415_a9938_350:96-2093(-)
MEYEYFKELLEPFYDRSVARHLIPDEEGKAIIDQINDICEVEGIQFTDLGLPPVPLSINRIPKDEAHGYLGGSYEWKRITDVFVEGETVLFDGTGGELHIDPDDVCQGELGNCWFVCQLSSLATYPGYIYHSIYPGQNYPGQINPNGIYGVRLNRWGTWYWVLVDDWLPFKEGFSHLGARALASTRSKNPHEYWPVVIEKAFAKINGSYQQLWAGMAFTLEPIHILTGRPCYCYCDSNPKRCFGYVKRLMDSGCFMVAHATYTRRTDGIVQAHGYTVLGTYEHAETGAKLVYLRNCWGHSGEWKGAWSDDSEQWKLYPEALEETGHTLAGGDGFFYIPHTDFTRIFSGVRVFPWAEANWPPAGEPGLPRSLREPDNPKHLFLEDPPLHKGMEAYGITTAAVGVMDVTEEPEGRALLLHEPPQFLLRMPATMPVRFTIKSEDSESYPHMRITKLGPLGEASLEIDQIRRLDWCIRGLGDTVVDSRIENWSDIEIPEGFHLVTLIQHFNKGMPLQALFKSARTLEFTPVPLGTGHLLHGRLQPDCNANSYEKGRQYLLDLTEDTLVGLQAHFPKEGPFDSGRQWLFSYKLGEDGPPPKPVTYDDCRYGDMKEEFCESGARGTIRAVRQMSSGMHLLIVVGSRTSVDFDISVSMAHPETDYLFCDLSE